MELTALGRKELLAKQLDRLLWRLPEELQDQILLWHFSVSKYDWILYCKRLPRSPSNLYGICKPDECNMCRELLKDRNKYIERFKRIINPRFRLY
jgi:hypothetical protein